ncbi:unnamed protein product [Rotaria magnacalcarata]
MGEATHQNGGAGEESERSASLVTGAGARNGRSCSSLYTLLTFFSGMAIATNCALVVRRCYQNFPLSRLEDIKHKQTMSSEAFEKRKLKKIM